MSAPNLSFTAFGKRQEKAQKAHNIKQQKMSDHAMKAQNTKSFEYMEEI